MLVIYNSSIYLYLHTTEFNPVVARITIMAVQLLITNSHIGTHHTISELHMAYAAFKAIHVIKQAKTFNYHRRPSSYRSQNQST